jgi:hypothetical protein
MSEQKCSHAILQINCVLNQNYTELQSRLFELYEADSNARRCDYLR